MKFVNILKQASRLSRGSVMIKKVKTRFFDRKGKLNTQELEKWLELNTTSFEELAIKLDQNLWEESLRISEEIEKSASKKLDDLGVDLGGGGMYPLLTFLVRYFSPKTVVETGVAAGFSSYAILESMKRNKLGELYSSDFPYFRLPNPEKFIGIVVPDNLKNNWNLYIEGDENNLPKIVSEVDNVDIFHYDSDKSYSGRKYAMDMISPKMNPNGFIVMDDIQDNSFFYDYVIANKVAEYYIYEFAGKYIGLIGKLEHLIGKTNK